MCVVFKRLALKTPALFADIDAQVIRLSANRARLGDLFGLGSRLSRNETVVDPVFRPSIVSRQY